VPYDARTYRLMSLDRVSLNTLEGRVVCHLLLGPRQHEMLVDPAWEIGGADLVWRAGIYYLHVTQSRAALPEDESDYSTYANTSYHAKTHSLDLDIHCHARYLSNYSVKLTSWLEAVQRVLQQGNW
jgi:hypothetical protein